MKSERFKGGSRSKELFLTQYPHTVSLFLTPECSLLIPVSFACKLILQELHSCDVKLNSAGIYFIQFLSTLQLKGYLHKYFVLFTQL
jgi:hypothetical protein